MKTPRHDGVQGGDGVWNKRMKPTNSQLPVYLRNADECHVLNAKQKGQTPQQQKRLVPCVMNCQLVYAGKDNQSFCDGGPSQTVLSSLTRPDRPRHRPHANVHGRAPRHQHAQEIRREKHDGGDD